MAAMLRVARVEVNTLVYEVAVYLSNNGVGTLGTTPTGSIFWRHMPSSPESCVGVIADSRPQIGVLPLSQLGFQVYVRNRSVGEGLGTASLVFSLLHGRVNVLPSLKGVAEGQAPGTYFRDANEVPVYPVSFGWLGHR